MKNYYKSIKTIFKDKKTFQLFLLGTFSKLIPTKWYLKKKFVLQAGYPLNLNNPQTFNEKLQWLKLHDRKPEYTKMVDKYEAKKYVADIIGEEHIIPTLAVYDSVDDIDFDVLPDQFVLKCTHDSGGLVICKDKKTLDINAAKQKLAKSLHHNFYWDGREWPYKNVKPRIIAEKYMTDGDGELKDYKVFTFGGEPKIIQIDYNRFRGHLRNLYNTNWERIDATIEFPTDPQRDFDKPAVLAQLLDLSRKLSLGTPHLRTDFYIVNNKIFFGEMTFFHGTGMEKITPHTFDKLMGDWIVLPDTSWGGVILKQNNVYVVVRIIDKELQEPVAVIRDRKDDFKFNYVFFNGSDGSRMSAYNEDGYYSICLRDLWRFENVLISNEPLDYTGILASKIWYAWVKFKLPFQRLWYPFFFKHNFCENKPYCFVIIGYSWPMKYYKWLREKYPDAVFVRFTRDLVFTQQKFIDDLRLTGVVDYWISYDENEAKRYGMYYHPEIESKVNIDNKSGIKYDVFFAGRAKKRLKKILEVYDILEKAGLKCFFYIMSAKQEEQIKRKGIIYSNRYLTYRQMLEYDMQSKCLLEINQEGAVGYTSRFIEAVMYNKLLLTDNNSVKGTPFYNPQYMQCFNSPSEIDSEFIKTDLIVDYDYTSEFSPIHFVDFLETLLK